MSAICAQADSIEWRVASCYLDIDAFRVVVP